MGTISSDTRQLDIFVERVDRGKSGLVWLFSSKTLDSIPDLYEEINVVSLDSVLPEVLVNARFLDIALFEWLAVFVGLPLFFFLTFLLNRFLSPWLVCCVVDCARNQIFLTLSSCPSRFAFCFWPWSFTG